MRTNNNEGELGQQCILLDVLSQYLVNCEANIQPGISTCLVDWVRNVPKGHIFEGLDPY